MSDIADGGIWVSEISLQACLLFAADIQNSCNFNCITNIHGTLFFKCFTDDILRPYLSSLAFAKSKEDSRPQNLNLQGQTFFAAISKEVEEREAKSRGAFKRQRPADGSAPGRESRHYSGLEGFELLSAHNSSLRFRNQLYRD